MPIIEVVVTQHAELAAFNWLLRDAAVATANYKLWELARHDDRVEAHLDGLRVAGEPGWEIVRTALVEIGEPGEVFASAVLAFEGNDSGKIGEVLEVATATPEAVRAAVSALGWLTSEAAARHAKPLLSAADPVLKRIGIAAAVVHRKNPGVPVLQDAFASDDAILKAKALRAVGELGLVDLHLATRANLKAKDPSCRFWAAWSTALLNGNSEAVALLQNIAETGGPFSERAAQMAMRRLPSKDARIWLMRLVKELRQMRIALVAAGALADPDAIPFIMDKMKDPKLARVAGESFSLITGANIAYEDLDGERIEAAETGPTEDPADEQVAMDRDLNLPWPDPVLIKKWWEARKGGYAKDTRYLLGKPITRESLREALKTGYQRQRAAAALELAILNPGKPLFEVRAPGFVQQKLLGGP